MVPGPYSNFLEKKIYIIIQHQFRGSQTELPTRGLRTGVCLGNNLEVRSCEVIWRHRTISVVKKCCQYVIATCTCTSHAFGLLATWPCLIMQQCLGCYIHWLDSWGPWPGRRPGRVCILETAGFEVAIGLARCIVGYSRFYWRLLVGQLLRAFWVSRLGMHVIACYCL